MRTTENRLKTAPRPQNEGARSPGRPRFSSFQRLGHCTAHPRAQLLRRCRPQHVPASHFVQDHTEDTPASAHSQTLQPQPILQAAIGRLDTRAHPVPLREHRGLLFPTTPSQAMILVGEIQLVATIPRFVDRARRAERASLARRRRHLDPRRARLFAPLHHQRGVPLRTGFHPPGPFVHREVVQGQRPGSLSGSRPGIGPTNSTPRSWAACTFSSPP